ncbi:NAD-dependent epimerase/dehydratase family protein [Amycolatopsis australiensis]|uniref:Nucleoside-diphosphate-sugar epimerase n=1 Tax=Amycolatopsis australiensis TaxID=546364 RepID=A0A1K1RTB4_9PSEU|nr:NAD-dependent epimerase/dehydratase family protein [Amycolatopsis australiensis]SFW75392.1 Nucleoside-diphosphate-sugar epimerase [Amycolatopsis australiensis]
MEIIGNGFIARHTRRFFGDRYPDVTLIAAGVSTVLVNDVSAFQRESALVYDVIHRCRAAGRTVIFLSTASTGMYGADQSVGSEGGAVFPLTPYGRHKLCLEHVCALSGARWLVLRLSHIVGPGQSPHQLLPSLTRQLLAGSVTLHSGVSRDLLDVGDMMRMLDSLLAQGVRDEVINVASGRSEAIEDIVDGLEERLGTRAERKLVDMPAKRGHVRIEKLRGLVAGFDELGIGPGYLKSLLDRNIGELAESAHHDLAAESAVGRL